MPRDSQHDKRRAVKMRVERNVPVIQAEFGQADLLDAESEVIRFILRIWPEDIGVTVPIGDSAQ
eukprot:11824426-Alexandrium_andersonii.AAC.1